MNKCKFLLHTNGMIILLVCILFGINLRGYVDLHKMQCAIQLILPLNLTLSLQINLHNKTLFYNINGGKVRRIAAKNNNKKSLNICKKIRIESVNYTLILGSADDCLKGLVLANFADYIVKLFADLSAKYVEIRHFEQTIIPDFNANSSKLMLNIRIKQGILDVISNLFNRETKKEVNYAN